MEKCWDVVEARDTTVQRQKKIISELHRALKKSQIETGISNRMTISFRDSLTNQKLATEKQKSKKIFNRKWAIVSDALLICETIYIYTRQTLFKW